MNDGDNKIRNPNQPRLHHNMGRGIPSSDWTSFARLLVLLCLIACKSVVPSELSTYLSSASVEVTSTAMADPLQEPALQTPPGVISQFPTTHSDEQAWYYVCAILSSIIPGTLLILRLYTKLRVVRKVDLTDCSISPSRFTLPILTGNRYHRVIIRKPRRNRNSLIGRLIKLISSFSWCCSAVDDCVSAMEQAYTNGIYRCMTLSECSMYYLSSVMFSGCGLITG